MNITPNSKIFSFAVSMIVMGIVSITHTGMAHSQEIIPLAQWSFSTGTSADLTSSNGLYAFSVTGPAPTHNPGTIALTSSTELVASGINSTTLPNLVTNATVWVRMKFDTAPGSTTGFFFGLINQTAPADWAQMSLTGHYSNSQIGQYSNTTTGAYGTLRAGVPATGKYFTMALVYTSGRDQNGFANPILSQFETYVNGVKIGSGSATGTTMTDLAFALGKLKASGGVAAMTFDEVRVYGASLNEAQIAALSNINFSSFGINEHPLSYSDYSTLIDRIAASGVKWVRISPEWGWIETSKGVYNTTLLTTLDNIVNGLIAKNINIDFILCYTAPWASSHSGDTRYPPTNQSDWSDYVTFITSRYQGKIRYWEVWNEQDGSGFWKGTVNEYHTLLQTAATAARTVDPNNQILMGGLATSLNGVDNYGLGTFFDQLMALGAGSYFDIVNYHAYGESARLLKVYQGMMDVVNKYGIQNKPVWITETGYTTNGTTSLEATKADYINGIYTMNTRFPNVSKTFYYVYRNTATVPVNLSEDNFGFVQNNLTPLPALAHYQASGQAMSDFNLQSTYPTLTPNTLTLYYIPTTSGDGSQVTNYNTNGTQKQIASGTYMYFAISNNWIYQGNQGLDSTVSIDVTYLDSGTGTWQLQCDSSSATYSSLSRTMTNTGKWMTATFSIVDAYFGNRQNNSADFRIYASNGAPLVIGAVAVRKESGTCRILFQTTNVSKLLTQAIDTNPANEGYTPVATIGGLSCRQISSDTNYCYLKANQGIVSPQDNNIQVGITFWDSGIDSLLLQYNATSNPYKSILITKTNTNAWRTVLLTLSDAQFMHSENYSCDMRIGNAYDGSVEYIRSVTLVNSNIQNPLH